MSRPSSNSYELWRQDDHGHRFLVGRYPTRETAERRHVELTRALHKQTYWIAESGSHTEQQEPI